MKKKFCLTALMCAVLLLGAIPTYADTTDDGRLVNGRALTSSSWGTIIDPLTVPSTFKQESGRGKYQYTVAVSGIYTIELWGEAGTDNYSTTEQEMSKNPWGSGGTTPGKISHGGRSGKGGYISGSAKLKKGDVLYFDLGTTASGGGGGIGSVNQAGSGFSYTFPNGTYGGAASTLFMGGTQANDRVLVAGGGAGGGGIEGSILAIADYGTISTTFSDGANGGAGGASCQTGQIPTNGVGGGGGGAGGAVNMLGNYWNDSAGNYPSNPGGTGGPSGTGGTSGRGGDNYVNTTIFTDHSSIPGESQSCKLKITLSTGGGMSNEDIQKILDEIGTVKGQISSLNSTVATKGDVTDVSETLAEAKGEITNLQTSMGGINTLLLDMQKQMAEEKKAITVVKDKSFDIMLFRVDNMDEQTNLTTDEYNIDLINVVPKDGIVELKGIVHTAGYLTVTFPDGTIFIINSIEEPDSGNVEVIFH